MQRAEAIQERAAVEGLTKMRCTHGAPSNASLELGPPFWRCAMVGVHPRRPVQRRPGTRTNHLWCGVIYTNPKKKLDEKQKKYFVTAVVGLQLEVLKVVLVAPVSTRKRGQSSCRPRWKWTLRVASAACWIAFAAEQGRTPSKLFLVEDESDSRRGCRAEPAKKLL